MAALAATAWTSAADAREARGPIDISASDLPAAVEEISREAGVSIGTSGPLPHIRTSPVHGADTVKKALQRVLEATDFRARQVGNNAWRIERREADPARADRQPRESALPPEAGIGQEIIVTGAKRAQSADTMPMAVVVVPFSSPSQSASVEGSALIGDSVEGLALTSLGAGRNRMFLRGVADSAYNGESQPTVAVVMDEARLTYSAADPDIRLVDVDRVEVLKGAQGALHGTGALGGVYHIVTRRAQTGETSLVASLGGVALKDGDAGFTSAATANLPIDKAGTVAVRLVGYAALEPGWIDTGPRKDSNRTRVEGGRIGLGVDAGAGWRLDATGFFQTTESTDSNYVYARGARSRPAQLAEPHDNDLHHVALRLAREGGGIDIVLTSGFTWHRLTSKHDATRGADGLGLADPLLLDDHRAFRVWDSEARISSSGGDVKWLLGISNVEARQLDRTTVSSADQSLLVDGENRKLYEVALFGNVSIPLAPRWRVDAGARLYRNTFREEDEGIVQDRHRQGITPSLAISWQPTARQTAFIRYGSAMRQGDFDTGAPGHQSQLKDDELQTLEIGWHMSWHGGSLDMGAWQYWWKDMQSELPQGNGLFETANAGDARIRGIEASWQQEVLDGLTVHAGANFTHARLVRNTLGFAPEDRRLPAVPDYTLRASVEQAFALGAGHGAVRLNLRYSGSAPVSFDPRFGAHTGQVLETNLAFEAQLGRTDVVLAVQNLLDRRTNAFSFGNPVRFLDSRFYTPQRPRQLSLSVTRRF